MKAESAFGVVENEVRDCRELKKETDNMITPSLESTSCSSAGIFEPVSPSVLSRGLCPSCPLSRESTHVVAVLTGWSLTCHLLFETVLKNIMNFLLRAKLGGQVSLAICLRYVEVGTFLFFSACWTKLATRTNTCCTTSPASLSSVLRLFLAYCHPNLCTQPFLCPSFGEVFLSVMLNYSTASAPPVTLGWIVAQVTKPTKNLLLASWTDHTTPL